MNIVTVLLAAAIGFLLSSKVKLETTLAGYSIHYTLLALEAIVIAAILAAAMYYLVRSILHEYTREAA